MNYKDQEYYNHKNRSAARLYERDRREQYDVPRKKIKLSSRSDDRRFILEQLDE